MTTALKNLSLSRYPVLHRMSGQRAVRWALAWLALIALVTAAAPWLAPADPDAQNVLDRLQGPSGRYWLGTDDFGRDQLSRLLMGTRTSIFAAVQAMVIALALGIPTGLIAGYLRGVVDLTFSRVADALLSIPPLVLAIAVIGMLGRGLTNAMIALGVTLAPRFFRIARSEAIVLRSASFIEASRGDGLSARQILLRHVLPNASSAILVQVTFTFGLVIMAEAGLGFLGLGARIPVPSWGTMLRQGFDVARQTVWPIGPPVIAMVLTVLSLFIAGDGLRDALGRTQARARGDDG